MAAASIRILRHDEYPVAAEFLDGIWQKNHVYCREKALFDWTFAAAPAWNRPDQYSFAVAEDSTGRLIGGLGAIVFRLNRHGQSDTAWWPVNWMVPEAHRSTGAGLALLNTFKREIGPSMVSFAINDIIARLYRKMGWEILETIPRLLWIPADAGERMDRLCQLCNADIAPDDLNAMLERMRLGGSDASLPTFMTLDGISGEDWDRNGWAIHEPVFNGCTRDHAYLNWRYLRHPIYCYQSAIIAEDGRLGLAVWRRETIHSRRADGVLEPIETLVRLVEFLPVSPANASRLLTVVRHDTITSGAMGIDFYSYHAGINNLLAGNGFVPLHDLPFGERLPNRFQPLDNRGGVIKSAVNLTPPTAVAGAADWYWTRSDSDQDRPN
jgi:hypothetical protein